MKLEKPVRLGRKPELRDDIVLQTKKAARILPEDEVQRAVEDVEQELQKGKAP